MTKARKIALFAVCMTLACIVVMGQGCRHERQRTADVLMGTWELYQRIGGEAPASPEDVAKAKDEGLVVYLQLDEDGSGTLDLFGRDIDVSWASRRHNTGTLTIRDDSATMRVDGTGMLSVDFGDEGGLVFRKIDPADRIESTGDTDEQAVSAVVGELVVDD
jgi:hypothetical protein